MRSSWLAAAKANSSVCWKWDEATVKGVFRFSEFELSPARRRLSLNGDACRIGDRALDILILLVGRAGTVVSRSDLMAQIWPNQIVDDAALRVQMVSLRKLLAPAGDLAITTVAGRGYIFTLAVTSEEGGAEPPRMSPAPVADKSAIRLIGRDNDIANLLGRLGDGRLVTIVGPGGIGKTSLAKHVARSDTAGAVFVELGAVTDANLIPSVIAAAVGAPAASVEPWQYVLEFARQQPRLIVLDNCEHVVDAVAPLIEDALDSAPQLRILATSREPIRIDGEWVHRLGPLDYPLENEGSPADDLRRFAAVRLFIERSGGSFNAAEIQQDHLRIVGKICRRLDGIPLAIELAASRLDALGLRDLAARLDDRFSLLTRGRRTALPRQQTLRATLDWSYELLSPSEQRTLRFLAIFTDRFTLSAAEAVVGVEMEQGTVLADIVSLIAKSMIAIDREDGGSLYHLLETTRAYAKEKLEAAQEGAIAAHAHLAFLVAHFRRARAAWTSAASGTWVREHEIWLEDVRSALDWALGPGEDTLSAAHLAIGTPPLWLGRHQMLEYLKRLQAIAARLGLADDPDLALQMQISALTGHAIYETSAPRTMAAAFAQTLDIAQKIGDDTQAFFALIGLYREKAVTGDYLGAASIADDAGNLAHRIGRVDAASYHQRLSGWAKVLNGLASDGLALLDQAIDDPAMSDPDAIHESFHFDPLVFAQSARARASWMLGSANSALRDLDAAIQRAVELDHSPSLFFVISVAAIPLEIWGGDAARIDRLQALLSRLEAADPIKWTMMSELLSYAASVRGSSASFEEVRRGMRSLQEQRPYAIKLLPTFHPALLKPAVLALVEQGQAGWCAPELVRAQGECLVADGLPGAAAFFERARTLAQRQGAVAWELRAATSLAKQRPHDAHALLEPVLEKLKDGFDTADVKAALDLLGISASS